MEEAKFKGKELIRSSKGIDKDVLSVVLKPDELYTEKEASKLIKDFMKKEVKE
ncbi:MAG: hypothetical protein VB130_10585 [Clostridium sp.]|nr:hypothetical protein [Clostridium sp.]